MKEAPAAFHKYVYGVRCPIQVTDLLFLELHKCCDSSQYYGIVDAHVDQSRINKSPLLITVFLVLTIFRVHKIHCMEHKTAPPNSGETLSRDFSLSVDI